MLEKIGENPYIKETQKSYDFNTNDLIKGALVGALATFLLTNETAQKAIFKVLAKGTQMMNLGVEELKERYEDVRAELEAEQEASV